MVANAQAYTGNYMSVGAGWCVVSTLFNPFLIFVGAVRTPVLADSNASRQHTMHGPVYSVNYGAGTLAA